MRINLFLYSQDQAALLLFNYQYPLSAAIYKIIHAGDAGFSSFLHNRGYGKGPKCFKLFTFSDIRVPFTWKGDRMQLLDRSAEVVVCFYLPKVAENLIKGLFIHQQVKIAGRKSKVVFFRMYAKAPKALLDMALGVGWVCTMRRG